MRVRGRDFERERDGGKVGEKTKEKDFNSLHPQDQTYRTFFLFSFRCVLLCLNNTCPKRTPTQTILSLLPTSPFRLSFRLLSLHPSLSRNLYLSHFLSHSVYFSLCVSLNLSIHLHIHLFNYSFMCWPWNLIPTGWKGIETC